VFRAELAEESHLAVVLPRISQGINVLIIPVVHDQEEIEGIKVGSIHLSCPVGQGIAAPVRCLPHAWVRQFAGMEVDRAGGIDFHAILQARILHHLFHDSVGRRGAADVSHADEEEFGS
jgi:hypothetical protein